MSYVSVIGGGSWGTTLALLLSTKGYDASLWVLEEDLASRINETGLNDLYLPGVTLPDNLRAYTSLEKVLKNCRFVINAVPTQHTRLVMTQALPFIPKDAIVVSASKGIEHKTHLTVSGIMTDVLGMGVSALSGPSFAREVASGFPTAVTVASPRSSEALLLQEIFNTQTFRVYTHDDIIGAEVGGALKNVIAVASGIVDGLGFGNNTRAALITRGLAEITRLGVKMGAKEQTFSGLSGLGDLVLTCTAMMSRNYSVGFRLGKGESLQEIITSTNTVAEGITTAKSAHELALSKGVEMPITSQVHSVLYEGKNPKDAVMELMTRSLKSEFHG